MNETHKNANKILYIILIIAVLSLLVGAAGLLASGRKSDKKQPTVTPGGTSLPDGASGPVETRTLTPTDGSQKQSGQSSTQSH